MAETPSAPSAIPPRFDFEELAPEREALRQLETEQTIDLGESPKMKILALTENTQHPLYELPPNAGEDLQQLQGSAQQKMILMVEYLNKLAGMGVRNPNHIAFRETTTAFLATIQKLETEAQETARLDIAAIAGSVDFEKSRSALRKSLKLKGEQKTFDDLLSELASPIQSPAESKVNQEPEMKAKLDETYRALVGLQYELLTFTFGPALRSLHLQENFPDVLAGAKEPELTKEEIDAVLKTVAVFIHQRKMYEARLQKTEPEKPSQLYAYLGVVANELGEEFAENSLNFSKLAPRQVPVLRFMRLPNWFVRMDIAVQRSMLVGFQQARGMIGANAPQITEVLGTLEKSPIGSKFWKQLMTIESPVTVALFAMHVHASGNPIKATMDFAGFLTASAASGALLASATELLAGAAIMAQRAKNTELALQLLTLARLPKHPAIQFAAAIGLAMGLAPVIDACTSWIDEQIPDGGGKRATNDAISIVSGASVIDTVTFAWGEDFGGFDPETDATTYLSREVLTAYSSKDFGLQSRKINGIVDWNDKVSRAENNETNPLMQKLHGLERADYGGPWTQRKAFELYTFVERAKQLQSAIGEELVKRGKLKNPASFDLLWVATSGDNEERPDWAVKRMEDDMDTPVGTSIAYIKGLDAKDELSQLWKAYRPLLKTISERVTTYRHLQIYNEAEWLGESGKKGMPPLVQKGIAAEVSYQMQRKDILTYRKDSPYDKATFMRLVTDVEERRARRDVPMKLQLSDEKAWPNIFTNPGDWLKRLETHNDINGNVLGKVDRHFLELVVGALKAETTQNKNSFRFDKVSEQILSESQENPQLASRAMLMAYAKTLPDEEIAKGLQESTFWSTEYNRLRPEFEAAKDPPTRLRLISEMLNAATNYNNRNSAGGVGSFEQYKKMPNGLTVSCDVHLQYDSREQRWYVETVASGSMPYIAISELGSRHRFPDMRVRETVPFSEWRKFNPLSAAKLAPQMLWHEKFMKQLTDVYKKVLKEAEEANKKAEEEYKKTEAFRMDQARETARKSPNTWVPFHGPMDKRYYEYVAFDDAEKAFVYLSEPKHERKLYASAPGTPVPSSDWKPGMQVQLENGKGAIVWNMKPDYQKVIETKYGADFARPMEHALTFPMQGEGSASAKAERTLFTMVSLYSDAQPISRAWEKAMEDALTDTKFMDDPEKFRLYFAYLRGRLHAEAVNGGKITPEVLRREAAKVKKMI
jgi:hypothetical protein